MKNTLIGVALGASLIGAAILPVSHTKADWRGKNLCPQWAQEMRAKPDDPRMHLMGCDDRGGQWRPVNSRCMRIAYRVSKREFDAKEIGRHGCVMWDDGSWDEE